MERRILDDAGFELRETDGKPGLRGYAAVYNRLSVPLGGGMFRERIAPGAFSSILAKSPDVRALIDHDPSKILGRTASGTLQLRNISQKGLMVDIPEMPDRSDARDLLVSIKRGDVSQMSFAFGDVQDTWGEEATPDGKLTLVRTIHEFGQLLDVSAVTFPAYPDTELGLRSAVESAKDYLERTQSLSISRALFNFIGKFR
jgi:HK97 family phage prohead protease